MADVGLSQDYRDLLVCLVDAGAEFLLVGGWALALHGHGRGTDDIGCVRNGRRPRTRSAPFEASLNSVPR